MYKCLFLITLLLFQVYIDPTIRACKTKRGVLLVVLHHMFFITTIFGSILYGFHKYHLVVLVGAFFVHYIKGSCPVTRIHNELCGFDEDKPLITVFNRLVPNYPNNIQTVIYNYYMLVLGLIVYDCVKIYGSW